ncbi:MAG: hypothetical protein PWP23_3051 [Candidatus Sumerlaeota bacterium]|nr:hypothetical protein [Candidatus Sumerlaeota bacterium]
MSRTNRCTLAAVALLPAALLTHLSAQDAWSRLPEDARFGLPGIAPRVPGKPASQAAKDTPPEQLANPDFETLDGSGLPSNWVFIGEPELREEAGNHYVRVNRNNFIRQSAVPGFKGRHRTLSARVRGELGFEGLWMRQVLFAPTRTQFPATRSFLDTTEWTRIHASHPLSRDTTSLWFEFYGADSFNWLDIDDVALFDEGIADGDFESPLASNHPAAWIFAGGAQRIADATLDADGATALELPPAARAELLATAIEDGQLYFITGDARAVGSGGEATLAETWRNAREVPLGSASVAVPVAAAPTPFFWQSGNFSGAHVSTVSFENTGAATLVLDNLARGLTRVYPETYYPGTESVEPLLELTAAWPERLASASAALFSEPGGALVDTVPLVLADGTAFAAWDGATQPAGDYTVRFTLGDLDGRVITIDHPLTIAANPGFMDPPAISTGGIERGAWLWLYNDTDSANDLRPVFQQARDDGFTFAVVFGRTSQWAAVRQVCDEIGLRFLIGDAAVMASIKHPPGFREFHRQQFIDLVESTVGPHFDSPNCMGFYAVDEPEGDLYPGVTAQAFGIASGMTGWKPPFVTISAIAGSNDRFNLIRPGVYWSDPYPFDATNLADTQAGLLRLADHVEDAVAAAGALHREYWLVAQAFSDPYFFRFGQPELADATIGVLLALGGKGYVPFFYRQINSLEGIRTFELDETPATAGWLANNARIAAAESDLAAITGHARFNAATGPVLVSTALDGNSVPVVYAVNLDVRRSIDLQMGFTANPQLTEITSGATLQAVSGSASTILGPGEWRVWRLSSGALSSAIASPRSRSERLVTLDVTAEATLSIGAINDLVFHDDGARLLATGPSGASLIDPQGATYGTVPLRSGLRGGFIDATRAAASDQDHGLVLFETAASLPLLPGFSKHTGTSTSALIGDGVAWNTMAYIGVRRMELESDGSLTPLDLVFSQDLVTDLVGPFDDGSAWMLDMDDEIVRLEPSGASGIAASTEHLAARLWRADRSPGGGRIAIARMQRGFLLAEADANGHLLQVREHPANVLYAEDVAWITDDLLALADTAGEIVFYTVAPNLGIIEAGRWLEPTGTATISTIAAHDGVLAVGYVNGRVQFLDASNIELPAAASDVWMILAQ